MKLIMADEYGKIMQEYGDVSAGVDGHPIDGNTLMVVIPGETGEACYCDEDPAGHEHHHNSDEADEAHLNRHFGMDGS